MGGKNYRIEVDIKKALKRFDAIPSILQEEAERMAGEVAEYGELEMKAIILTSGTEFSDAARRAGINRGPGRFRTGKMYNSVTSKTSVSGDIVSAEYGWLGQVRKYFLYQDKGFRNLFSAAYSGQGALRVQSGAPIVRRRPNGGFKTTEGMFSLRDSEKSLQARMPRFLKQYRARVTRRINRGDK
jgi:hypothetical protein